MNILNGPNGATIIVGGLAVIAATVVLFNSRRIIEGVGAGVGSGINAGVRNAVDGIVPSIRLPTLPPVRPPWAEAVDWIEERNIPSPWQAPRWSDFIPNNPFR